MCITGMEGWGHWRKRGIEGEGGEGEEWLEGGGVVRVSCLFITSFFLTTVQFVLSKS